MACWDCWHWTWKKGPQARGCRRPLKGLVTRSPLEPPEGTQPCVYPDFSPVKFMSDLWPIELQENISGLFKTTNLTYVVIRCSCNRRPIQLLLFNICMLLNPNLDLRRLWTSFSLVWKPNLITCPFTYFGSSLFLKLPQAFNLPFLLLEMLFPQLFTWLIWSVWVWK